ncbi:MAG: LytR family transcriptional regulator, partial [Actinobacteria bacterium]|nr:LytR family transcriptional regulator [Actinomycetota bacterium]
MSRYPEDEFDIAARNRGPKGVHRQAESTFRRLLPFLV